ncbi:hypothetical protein SAMN04488483_3159 [Pseudomonas helmanticensis]|uniref:Uncharacterized protein n=1 Tax=Pseudomonas helmanticensis TaxID=1471381 RepID=A0ACD2U7J0_9PSED|nr:hypothetical protein SAMN04488483_3159 [Pseudomonas helmanticensis]
MAMNIFQRIVLLLKVLVMLSLGTSAAWASTAGPAQGFNAPHGHGGVIVLAKSESEPGDQVQGGSKDDDDSTTDEPDTDDDDGDSQT